MSNKRQASSELTHNDKFAKVQNAGGRTSPQQEISEVDNNGHFVCRVGAIIKEKYKVETVLGEGAYGRVIRVTDIKARDKKAIKVFKKEHQDGAISEINALNFISRRDPEDTSKCIKMFDWMTYNGHTCIIFQQLGLSTFDFLEENHFQPYPLSQIRHIAYQLCNAVHFLHKNGITHTDIKPENILFVDSNCFTTSHNTKINREVRTLKCTDVRLIDFGNATRDGDYHSPLITTRHYRAPEVILDIGWTQTCDVWSIGCTLYELCCGKVLFSIDDDCAHLATMEQCFGAIPHRMVNESPTKYCEELSKWKSTDADFLKYCQHLRDWLYIGEDTIGNLIRRMLEYEPLKRIKLDQAIAHPFFKKLPPHQKIISKEVSSAVNE